MEHFIDVLADMFAFWEVAYVDIMNVVRSEAPDASTGEGFEPLELFPGGQLVAGQKRLNGNA